MAKTDSRIVVITGVSRGLGLAMAEELVARGGVRLAAVHVQQYASLLHEVRWIGPLFLANAAASVVTIIGLAYWRTRALAALGGVVISALALGSLVVSYGHGLLGWQEGGFRTAVAIAVTTEMCAAILLSAALTTAAVRRHAH